MSQIADLTQKVQRKSQELLNDTERVVKTELEKLENATKQHCKSVQNELQNATQTAETFHKTLRSKLLSEHEKADSAMKTIRSFQVNLGGELDSIERMMRRRMARMATIFIGAVGLILALVAAGAIALTTYYIKPAELAEQLQQRMELERSGMLVRAADGTYIVMPPKTKCWMNSKLNKRVCRLPDPPRK